MAYVHERAVRFADVDAAGVVYFPRFLDYCHETMEDMLAGLEGGYAGAICGRRIGLPAVHLAVDFKAPLRFGDMARITLVTTKVGTSSATLRYTIVRKGDGVESATVEHVVVAASLDPVTKIPIPDDIRAALVAIAI